MKPKTPRTRLCILVASAMLAACASGPPRGGEAWVGIDGAPGADELRAAEAALRAAGIGAAELAAGRVLRATCSPSVDAIWSSLVVLAPGQRAERGQVLRLRAADDGDARRLGVNAATGAVEPALTARLPAYRGNERVRLEPPQRGRYREVQGSYVIAC